MKKVSLFITLVFALIQPIPIWATQIATPHFDDRQWHLGWSGSNDKQVLDEYVLKGEQVSNWTELVTVQFFPGLQQKTNLDVFEGMNREMHARICPNIQWQSLEQSDNERMWKWEIHDCQGQPSQSEIVRIVKTKQGFHIWHYAAKQSPLPADKEKTWVANLKKFTLSDPTPQTQPQAKTENKLKP